MLTIEVHRCDGCGDCVGVCPEGAIQLVGGLAQIDLELCTECEACVEACPSGAIKVARPLAVREPVTERAAVPSVRLAPEAIQVRLRTAPVPLRTRLAPLMGSALSFLGRQIVPRLAPHLVSALDRRLSEQAGLATRARGLRGRRRRGGGRRGR